MGASRVVVVGAGGMGALFGAILQDGGLCVTLLDVDREHVDAIVRDGLRISGYGGERVRRLGATIDPETIQAADVILFQTKGRGTTAAAHAVKRLVEGGAVCVSLQNGLGNEAAIANVVGDENVLGGLTAMAGERIAPGWVRDFSRAPTYVGEMKGGLSERAEWVAAMLSEAGLETRASADIVAEIWKKLLGNIAMSAVSGAAGLTLAACLSIPELRETSFRALDEALAVAQALGVRLDREEAVRGLEVITAPGGAGDARSSLAVDILNSRPTEVDFIYGAVIAEAEATGTPVPTLKTLASIVKGLESGYL